MMHYVRRYVLPVMFLSQAVSAATDALKPALFLCFPSTLIHTVEGK